MSAEKLLQSLFVEHSLDDPGQANELFSQLRDDEALAHDFDVLAITTRELEGVEPDTMSQMELDFHELHFMHALDAQLASESQPDSETLPADNVIPVDFSRQQLTLHIMAIAAMLCVTLGAGILLRPTTVPPDEGTFEPRGTHDVTTPSGPMPALEVFCLTRDETGKVKVKGKKEAAFGVVACPQHGEVQFASVNPQAAGFTHVAMFGMSEHGELLWYGPSPAHPAPRRVPFSDKPGALGESIKLDVNHKPGTIKTYAIFSRSPIDHVMLMKLTGQRPARRPHDWTPAPDDLPRGAVVVDLTFDVVEVSK